MATIDQAAAWILRLFEWKGAKGGGLTAFGFLKARVRLASRLMLGSVSTASTRTNTISPLRRSSFRMVERHGESLADVRELFESPR